MTFFAPDLDSGVVETCYVSLTVSNNCGSSEFDSPLAIVVGPTPGPGRIVVTPGSLDFGVVMPETTDTLELTIHNTAEFSDLRVAFSTIAPQISTNEQYVVISNPLGAAPTAFRSVLVYFAPHTEQALRSQLPMHSNDPNNERIRIEVTGNVTLPEFNCLLEGYLDPDADCTLGSGWEEREGNKNGRIDLGDLLFLLKHSTRPSVAAESHVRSLSPGDAGGKQ